MKEGLETGRRKGYKGWDQYWQGVNFPSDPLSFFLTRLHNEIDELVIAISNKNVPQICNEAADVANFAMFISDIVENSDWYVWSNDD